MREKVPKGGFVLIEKSDIMYSTFNVGNILVIGR
jgi:hypothetical protein